MRNPRHGCSIAKYCSSFRDKWNWWQWQAKSHIDKCGWSIDLQIDDKPPQSRVAKGQNLPTECNIAKNHFDPKPSETVQSLKCDSRNHKCDEAVMNYVAELRQLAQDCNTPCRKDWGTGSSMGSMTKQFSKIFSNCSYQLRLQTKMQGTFKP